MLKMQKRAPLVTAMHRLLFLVSVAIAAIGLLNIPQGAELPFHWAASGAPDATLGRNAALLVLPCVGVALIALVYVLGRIGAPWQVEPGRHVAEAALSAALLVMAVCQFGILLIGIGSDIDVIRLLAGAVAVGLLVLGNELRRADADLYGGLRLPWPVEGRRNWRWSHGIAGVLYMAAGVGLAVLVWRQPDPATLMAGMGLAAAVPALCGALVSVVLRGRN